MTKDLRKERGVDLPNKYCFIDLRIKKILNRAFVANSSIGLRFRKHERENLFSNPPISPTSIAEPLGVIVWLGVLALNQT